MPITTGPVHLLQFLLWKGKILNVYPCAFPIFDLVHVQLIWLFWYRWTTVDQNSFYPVTGLSMKRTAYPVTLVPEHSFLWMCIMLFLIKPKICEFYCTLNQTAGVVGNKAISVHIFVCSAMGYVKRAVGFLKCGKGKRLWCGWINILLLHPVGQYCRLGQLLSNIWNWNKTVFGKVILPPKNY